MYYIFNKSCIGYSHLKRLKPCQDFSASYKDNSKMIITCCDGHGGDIYVRSDIGSNLASNAIMNVFSGVNKKMLLGLIKEEFEKNIKLSVLCEWNKMVERYYSIHKLKKKELINLNDEQINRLKKYPVKAYGTTLTGALVYDDKLIVIGIGDSEIIGIKDGNIIKVFDDDNDPAANITYSMCQEDAYDYLRVKVLDFNDMDGIMLCTDGLSSPYQTYENFNKSFLIPMVNKIMETKSLAYIDEFIDKMALNLGTGDDVSVAFIIKDKNN